ASYARAVIELRADVDLRDTIVVDIPKFSGLWTRPDDCPKKIISDISKNSKMPRQPANGNLKVQMANKATTPILNSFDALSTLVDEENGGGNQTPSTNATPLVAKINELERRILDEKLVLVNKAWETARNEESYEDEVELPDDETSRYMSSTSGGGFREDDLDFMTDTRLRFEAQLKESSLGLPLKSITLL
ncbi:hypothetical protein Tco_0983211, partial [Tanacetum coccineum]